jgi:hypothetical protein
MIRRCAAALTSLTVVLALSACSPIGVPDADPAPELPTCLPEERFLRIAVDAVRPPPQGSDSRINTMLHAPVEIWVQGLSPVPGYRGVDYISAGFGTGITGINPVKIEATTPYDAVACWPVQNPVLFVLRAYFAHPKDWLVFDRIDCTMSDGHNPTDDYLQESARAVEAADYVPDMSYVLVQCVDAYVPGGYSGPPLPPVPQLPF